MVIAVSAIVLQSCKSKPSEKEMQGIAEEFLKALVNEDYDKAKELGNDATDGDIENIKMFSLMVPDSLKSEMDSARTAMKGATFNFGETTFNEEGTEVTVKYTTSITPTVDETITLKKVDDKWLVDMKADMPSN